MGVECKSKRSSFPTSKRSNSKLPFRRADSNFQNSSTNDSLPIFTIRLRAYLKNIARLHHWLLVHAFLSKQQTTVFIIFIFSQKTHSRQNLSSCKNLKKKRAKLSPRFARLFVTCL